MAQYGESQQAGPARSEGTEPAELAGIDPADVLQAAAQFAREHPHTAVAGGLVVGFLLGGGLTPRLLASLALFAGRRYAAEAARAALEDVVRDRIEQAGAAS
jgi:hypothetical protein